MRDIFFTILAVWVVYRIWNGIQTVNARSQHNTNEPAKKAGSVSVDYVPPKKNKNDNDDGEYVDYEEIK
jgi:hypothetical protein